MKKILIPLLMAGSLSLTSVAADQQQDKEKKGPLTRAANAIDEFADRDLSLNLGNGFKIGVEGQININSGTMSDSSANLENSYATIALQINKKMKLYVSMKFNRLLSDKDNNLTGEEKEQLKSDFERTLDQVYLRYATVKGTPYAILVGKMPMSFGMAVEKMPIFSNNPMYRTNKIDEVFGLTFQLDKNFFNLFNKIEASIFESQAGDMSIGKIDSYSIRLLKDFNNMWAAMVSHASVGNEHLSTGRSTKTSVGLLYQSNDENNTLKGWFEYVHLDNDHKYQDADFAVTGGMEVRVSEKVYVIGEITYVDNYVTQYAAGVKFKVTDSVTLGVDMRYNDADHESIDDGLEIFFNTQYTFGNVHRMGLSDLDDIDDIDDMDLD